jgi:predicted DNA-binding transcriptional regulator YafY
MTGINRTDRLRQIQGLLSTRRVTYRSELMEKFGVSRATLGRDIQELRDRFQVPIDFDPEYGGYRLGAPEEAGGQFELPHMWFSAEEIHALLTMQHLLSNLDTSGLLGSQIKPLLNRLTKLLGAGDNPSGEVARRIRIETVAARSYRLEHFQSVGSGLLRRRRLVIGYHARGTDEHTRREVSPQRLVHYRDNWYLDAWCHLRNQLRAFAVDAISDVRVLDRPAVDIDDTELDRELGSGYGIFSGASVLWAKLLFSAERARWVANEKWHPAQQGRFLDDGRYWLSLPYSREPELIMDILRHGRHVTVLAPDLLRHAVQLEHLAASKNLGACSQIEPADPENPESGT